MNSKKSAQLKNAPGKSNKSKLKAQVHAASQTKQTHKRTPQAAAPNQDKLKDKNAQNEKSEHEETEAMETDQSKGSEEVNCTSKKDVSGSMPNNMNQKGLPMRNVVSFEQAQGESGINYPDDRKTFEGQHSHHDHYHHHGHQEQMVMQMQRAAEASKQMLYGVFGNFVSILEEYEARTHETKAKRSKIALPDQSRKTVEDVQSIVQTQLLLFETQQRACPKEVSQSVNKELRKKTLHWAAVRHEKKMPINETDKYICQLYEVLVKGKTKHDILEKPREPVSAKTIRENFQHILKGKHDAQEIDQQFKHDDKKKATSPKTRRSNLDDACKIGAQRMEQAMPELVEFLSVDLLEFQADGPETIQELR